MPAEESELLDRVRRAWSEVLQLDTVPLNVGFLDAGGNSLLLIILWEQLQGLTERCISPTDLFKHNTIRQQVELLRPAADGMV